MNAAEQSKGVDLPHIRFFGLDNDAGDLPELAEVGGKAVNLCKLSRAKLPVPPGFVVTTQAYRGFLGEDGLSEKIAAMAAKCEEGNVRRSRPSPHKSAGCWPRSRCTNRWLRRFFRPTAGCGMRVGCVAVRSSATAEDLPEASFAGQQDTYLTYAARNRSSRRCNRAGQASGRQGPSPTARGKRPRRRA